MGDITRPRTNILACDPPRVRVGGDPLAHHVASPPRRGDDQGRDSRSMYDTWRCGQYRPRIPGILSGIWRGAGGPGGEEIRAR